MTIRMPVVAGAFYPLQPAACRNQVAQYLENASVVPVARKIVAGIVPHAGWVYSADTAAHVFKVIASQPLPDTVILLGAVHRWGVNSPSVYPGRSWRTPLGDVLVDVDLAEALVTASGRTLKLSAGAHDNEHSIEVQLPFVQVVAPHARILPIAVPPEPAALDLGEYIIQALVSIERKVVVIASSDLTHYGPNYGFTPAGVGQRGLEWSKDNDARVLRLAGDMQSSDVLQAAERTRSACGAGAIAAAAAYARAAGAEQGTLLHYTTSYDVMPSGRPTDFVGYGAVVFA